MYIVGALHDLYGFLPKVWGEVVGCQATSYNLNGARRKEVARHNEERRLLETVSDAIRGKTGRYARLCAIAELDPSVLKVCSGKSDADRAEAVRATVARLVRMVRPEAPADLESWAEEIPIPADIEIGRTRSTDAKGVDQFNGFIDAMYLKLGGRDDAVFRVWTTIPTGKREPVEIVFYDVLRHLTRVSDASGWGELEEIRDTIKATAEKLEAQARATAGSCAAAGTTMKLNVSVGMAPWEEE